MDKLFILVSDHVEEFLSWWIGFSMYTVGMGVAYWLWGWDGIDRYIYVSGALILILVLGSGRRDTKAIHARLDKLTPDDTLNRLEERTEAEIEALRD
jgi:low affinity Fe/Cu permease